MWYGYNMTGGMPNEMRDLMKLKYGIKQQEADARTTTAQATAQNADTASTLAPSEVGLNKARARNFNVDSDLMPRRVRFENLLKRAQADNQTSLARRYDRGGLAPGPGVAGLFTLGTTGYDLGLNMGTPSGNSEERRRREDAGDPRGF